MVRLSRFKLIKTEREEETPVIWQLIRGAMILGRP